MQTPLVLFSSYNTNYQNNQSNQTNESPMREMKQQWTIELNRDISISFFCSPTLICCILPSTSIKIQINQQNKHEEYLLNISTTIFKQRSRNNEINFTFNSLLLLQITLSLTHSFIHSFIRSFIHF